LDKQQSYTHEESVTQRIDLSKNFRSRKEVIDTVNSIFEALMDEDEE
jgi:ATP-dependent helicase/nuclease subunit A